jgi:hypothetical protein
LCVDFCSRILIPKVFGQCINLLERKRVRNNTSQKAQQRNEVYTKDDSVQAIAATYEVPRRLETFAACRNVQLFFAENKQRNRLHMDPFTANKILRKHGGPKGPALYRSVR